MKTRSTVPVDRSCGREASSSARETGVSSMKMLPSCITVMKNGASWAVSGRTSARGIDTSMPP